MIRALGQALAMLCALAVAAVWIHVLARGGP